ncbi:hypothetical protein A2U01_0091380, partial [Trifolium medium]|nr:hypothetical protein [Trifolium medium]
MVQNYIRFRGSGSSEDRRLQRLKTSEAGRLQRLKASEAGNIRTSENV